MITEHERLLHSWRQTVEATAVISALNSATIIAREQGSCAFVSVEAGDYHVGEAVFPDEGRPLCKVNPNGDIDWEE